jgi:hypothetical protein
VRKAWEKFLSSLMLCPRGSCEVALSILEKTSGQSHELEDNTGCSCNLPSLSLLVAGLETRSKFHSSAGSGMGSQPVGRGRVVAPTHPSPVQAPHSTFPSQQPLPPTSKTNRSLPHRLLSCLRMTKELERLFFFLHQAVISLSLSLSIGPRSAL